MSLKPQRWACGALIVFLLPGWLVAGDTVATTVYSRVAKGYKREKAKDGTFKAEYYVMTNGGRIEGTISDITVDRVTYTEVAEIARQLLTKQNFQLAPTKEQAVLLLVLNWGSTLAPNGMDKQMNVAVAQSALRALSEASTTANQTIQARYEGQDVAKNAAAGFNRSPQFATNEEMAVVSMAGSTESAFFRSLTDDRVRDQLNERNARILGYLDDLSDANDIRRYAGGGDRYQDLIGDVEESRYYIVVSAYDLRELEQKKRKKLLWQTRVSVRSPGNSFNDSYLAMLKSASAYFGQNSGKLVRGEEAKGTVELGDLKFLGVVRDQPAPPAPVDQTAGEEGDPQAEATGAEAGEKKGEEEE